MTSFERAAAEGFSIETDLWADAQGQMWIFHDRNTLRSTGVDGYIDKMTTAQVAALRYKKAGSRIPTLEEAMAYWATIPETRVYIELKQQTTVERVAQQIRDAGRVDTTWFTTHAAYTHRVAPDIRLAARYITSPPPDPQVLTDQGVDIIIMGPTGITATEVDRYQAGGIEVQDRLANDTREWRNTIGAGANAQLTDFPQELVSFCPDALQPPTIEGFTPSGGPAGTPVTVTGDFFTDASRVTFGNVSATFVVDSRTQLTAVVPENVPARANITVRTPNGSVTSSTPFQAAPAVVDTFTPTTGSPGTPVVVTGAGFLDATAVAFGTASAPFVVDSDTQITATVPTDVPASSRITVTTPSTTVESNALFTATRPVGVDALSPSAGVPGTAVVITGTNLSETSAVAFGASSASYTVDSDTQITAIVPVDAPAVSKVSVTTPTGTVQSTDSFKVPPTIGSFTPTTGTNGSSVVITGTGFAEARFVRFGAVTATFTIDSPTQITATVPADAPASSKLGVTTPAGTTQSTDPFKMPPTIGSFTPTTGTNGSSVVITGTGFAEARFVRFGAVTATFTIDSPTQITATVPADAPASSKLGVTTPAGTAQSTDPFKVAPTITSFTPSSARAGSSVVITGTGFLQARIVRFGAVTATFTVDSPTQITATVPANAPARSKLGVVTPGGVTQSQAAFQLLP
ncbi:hypothetical protein NOCARDAX2BIS_80020 [Nocardioides sp. AX2bis]|nr:hypothetical protein NOCARDAX2BIS_80020 [Nocardioides sp. AX2bis]